MKDSFYTAGKAAEIELEIKRSKFIAAVSSVDDEAAANSFIDLVKENHKRATHNVFAYLISEQVMRCSDDGEPAGTAGRPVLSVIEKQNLLQTAVVVTRYFGGVKLGAGGLVRAYSDAAKRAVDEAGIVEKRLHREITLWVPYELLAPAKRQLELADGLIQNVAYAEQVAIMCLLPQSVDILPLLDQATAGEAKIEVGGFCYL